MHINIIPINVKDEENYTSHNTVKVGVVSENDKTWGYNNMIYC